MISRIASLAIIVLISSGCDTTNSIDAEDLLVIEAFVYEGEPVDDITLTKVVSLDLSEDEVDPEVVNDAVITITKNEIVYVLSSSGADGKYEYAGSDLEIATGDSLRLRVESEGSTLIAETTVPARPDGILITEGEIVIPEFGGGPGQGGPGGPRGFLQDDENGVSVEWENSEGDTYFVAIRTPASDNPDYILPEFIRNRFGGIEIVTLPTTANFHDIRLFDLEVIGPYTATVYRINQEYVDLYLNREQDSRDLNEPPSNIEGGLGIFSAFSSQTVEFDVVRE